jgi:thiol-disulfide isomerase/thioredoxin
MSSPDRLRCLPIHCLLTTFLLGVAVTALTSCQPGGGASGANHPQVGGLLGNLHLQPLTGDARPIELVELRGKVVLLNFWGTWCGPCVTEFPHIAALQQKHRDNPDLVVLPVSCEPGGSEDIEALREGTQAFLDRLKVSIPTYADPDVSARQVVARYVGFTGYPKTLVLDRQGIVRGIWDGYMPGDETQVQDLVWRLLRAKE